MSSSRTIFVDQGVELLSSEKERELNRQNLQVLLESLDSLIPFVGAGLSADFGYPAWHKLIGRLAGPLGLSDQVAALLKDRLYEDAAELVAKNPNFLDDNLRITFAEESIPRPITAGALRHLPRISRGVVITTNFDHLLECVYEDSKRPFARGSVFPGSRIREASAAVQQREHCLLKLHGDYADSESRILTLTQYQREYGGDKPEAIDINLALPKVLSQALASGSFLFLGCSLKQDRTVQVVSQLAKRYPGVKHFALLSDGEAAPDRVAQLYDWNIRPIFFKGSHYHAIDKFLELVAAVTSRRPSPAHRVGKRKEYLPPPVRINGYKLYYFRRNLKYGTRRLGHIAKVREGTIKELERVNEGVSFTDSRAFKLRGRQVLSRLEEALSCPGKLEAGQSDDFLSDYMLFYRNNRRTPIAPDRIAHQAELPFETKAIVFDFDGTLTRREDEETTWEKLWVKLGYSINDCAELHFQFSSGKLDHQKWCDLTLAKFRARGLRLENLNEVADSTTLMPGTKDTLEQLNQHGIKLYILSGSIKSVIRRVLGSLLGLFEDIQANEIDFDRSGLIRRIKGTKYDFKGKASYLTEVVKENAFSPHEVLFVGNSCNDIYAIRSGVRTLCVNPRAVNPDDKHWTYYIRRMDNLHEITRFIGLQSAKSQ